MSLPFSLLAVSTFARRRAAWVAAWLLAAQLALFAHALTHEYAPDLDHAHVVCSLCTAAHQFDHGVAPAALEVAYVTPVVFTADPSCVVALRIAAASFRARAPPVSIPLA